MNVKLTLNHNRGYSWEKYNSTWAKGYLFYNGELYEGKRLAEFFDSLEDHSILRKLLQSVFGIFTAIKIKNNEIWLVQDVTRTFPIFYSIIDDAIFISDDTFYLKEVTSSDVSEEAIIEFLRVLYVLGNKTILSAVKQVQAGEIVKISEEGTTREFYHTHFVTKNELFAKDFSLLKKGLKQVFENVVARLIKYADGDPIVIPLSGGYDSRLIATLLKMHGYDGVITYTYGYSDSHEVKTAKKVADKLGYEWYHIGFKDIDKDYFESYEFHNFVEYSFNHVSTPHILDFYAFKVAVEEGIVPKNAIVVPGHSGDVFSGSWLIKLPLPTKRNFHHILFAKHFILNEHYNQNRSLKNKLKKYFKDKYSPEVEIHSLDDNWNFKERQAKYIVNSNRAYEFFGYRHAIPLWDLELVEFFRRVPLELKTSSPIYNEVAMEYFKETGVDFRKPSGFTSGDLYKKMRYFAERCFPYWIKRPLRDYVWKDQVNFRVLAYPLSQELGRKYYFSECNGIVAEWVLHKFGYLRRRRI